MLLPLLLPTLFPPFLFLFLREPYCPEYEGVPSPHVARWGGLHSSTAAQQHSSLSAKLQGRSTHTHTHTHTPVRRERREDRAASSLRRTNPGLFWGANRPLWIFGSFAECLSPDRIEHLPSLRYLPDHAPQKANRGMCYAGRYMDEVTVWFVRLIGNLKDQILLFILVR